MGSARSKAGRGARRGRGEALECREYYCLEAADIYRSRSIRITGVLRRQDLNAATPRAEFAGEACLDADREDRGIGEYLTCPDAAQQWRWTRRSPPWCPPERLCSTARSSHALASRRRASRVIANVGRAEVARSLSGGVGGSPAPDDGPAEQGTSRGGGGCTGRLRELHEAEPLQDRAARGQGVDLEVAEAPLSGDAGAVRDESAVDAAPLECNPSTGGVDWRVEGASLPWHASEWRCSYAEAPCPELVNVSRASSVDRGGRPSGARRAGSVRLGERRLRDPRGAGSAAAGSMASPVGGGGNRRRRSRRCPPR